MMKSSSPNPFSHLVVSLSRVTKDWHYVSMEELEKLLCACPTVGWKALIGLYRLAGLRRGEAMALAGYRLAAGSHHRHCNQNPTPRKGEARRAHASAPEGSPSTSFRESG